VLAAFYYSNFFKFVQPKKEEGRLVWQWPMPADKQLPMYDVADTGAWVVEAFNHPDKWIGKSMKVATEFLTPKQVAATAKAHNPALHFVHADLEQYKHSGTPGAEELSLNYKFFVDNQEDSGLRDVKWTRSTYPQAVTWEAFLPANEAEIKKMLAA